MASDVSKELSAIVIGTSAGGFQALNSVLAPLPEDFPLPILVVRHQSPDSNDYLVKALQQACRVQVQHAQDGQTPQAGRVYIAPPGRHLRIRPGGKMGLSDDEPVNFSRPSIDVLFSSAAEHYGKSLLAVILTGANSDGAAGVQGVKNHGGCVMVQDPASAHSKEMPQAAQAAVEADWVVWLDQIGPQLWSLTRP